MYKLLNKTKYTKVYINNSIKFYLKNNVNVLCCSSRALMKSLLLGKQYKHFVIYIEILKYKKMIFHIRI